jgi:hypothetical protein
MNCRQAGPREQKNTKKRCIRLYTKKKTDFEPIKLKEEERPTSIIATPLSTA